MHEYILGDCSCSVGLSEALEIGTPMLPYCRFIRKNALEGGDDSLGGLRQRTCIVSTNQFIISLFLTGGQSGSRVRGSKH